MPEINHLLELPTQTILVLVSGYLGYRIAYTGVDKTHKAIDIVFMSLAFAVLAQTVLDINFELETPEIYSYPMAMSTALLGACLWRAYGQGWVFHLLREVNVSNADRHITAWDTIRSNVLAPTAIVVRKLDGTAVMSAPLQDFKNTKPGPVIWGEDGSVGLYITNWRKKQTEDWEEVDTEHSPYGKAITYIPANQICEIEIFNN